MGNHGWPSLIEPKPLQMQGPDLDLVPSDLTSSYSLFAHSLCSSFIGHFFSTP